MNDTISLRRNQVLSLLAEKPRSRAEISSKLPGYSKITLIRDLNYLEKTGEIKSKGQARATVYYSTQNLLLRKFDVNPYFSSNRNLARTKFNPAIFDYFAKFPEEKISLKSLSEHEKKLDPTIFRREIERFTVEFAWKSSLIEGNTYTLLETEMLIKQAREAFGHSQYEAIMILNHKKAVDFILQNRELFKKLDLEKAIKLHGILTGDLEISGGIRRDPVAITGTNYVPPTNPKDYLIKIIELINKTKFSVTKAMIAGCMIPYLQPFTDGNKRMGRTLANAILIAYDLYPLSYRDASETDYIKAMILFYEQNSLYLFRQMFLSQLEFSQNNYFRTI